MVAPQGYGVAPDVESMNQRRLSDNTDLVADAQALTAAIRLNDARIDSCEATLRAILAECRRLLGTNHDHA